LNLALVDIIACVFQMPYYVAELAPKWSPLPGLCVLQDLTVHWAASIIPLSVLLIAIDQYLAVTDPLHYHFYINRTKSAILIVAAWLVSVLAAVGSILVPRPGRGSKLCRGDDEKGME